MPESPAIRCHVCGVLTCARDGRWPRFCRACGMRLAQSPPWSRPFESAPARRNPRLSALAGTALFFSLISLFPACIPAGVLGIILGLVAQSEIEGANGRLGGITQATFAIWLGAITTILWFFGGAACCVL